MSEDDLERTLREAFTARAADAVGESRPVPPPRFAAEPPARAHRARWLAPLAAAAAVVAVVGGVLVVGRSSGGHRPAVAVGHTGTASPLADARRTSRPAASSARPVAPDQAVHVRLFNQDGATYGVGMPVIAIFNHAITDARPFARATSVTVDGAPVKAAWYFQPSAAGLGAMEAHLRPKDYWPAHAKVHVALPVQGVSAGRGLSFDDSLTLDFTTGARTIATVDDRNHRLTIRSDGRARGSFPVSLGAARTPTLRGIKVIMEKKPSVCMTDVNAGYKECGVRYAQRLTYSGEYLHAAPWNVRNIELGVDSSNGCTNLLPTDAARLYSMLIVGDVVQYPDATGPVAGGGSGFTDWDVPWSTWRTGGLLPTS